MIRVRQTAKTKGAEELAEFYSIFPNFAMTEFENTVKVFSPSLLAELKKPVGPVRYPIVWTSDDQKWAYVFTKGFGRGIPTVRTGAARRGWQDSIEQRANKSVWVVENPVKYARFLYGTLNKNLRVARRTQQRFHANTGYQLAAQTIEDKLVDFREAYRNRIMPSGNVEFIRRASKSRGKV